MIKQVFMHEPVVALKGIWLHWPVLVKVECDDVLE